MNVERKIGPTAAESYMSALLDNGIKYVFANAGTDFAPIIEGLVRMKSQGVEAPEFVTVPHENVAMAMAQGYSKVTHEASAVMVHVNVGTANCICGLMNAARDNVPVLLAAGRTPLTETGHAGSRDSSIHWTQENFDQAGIVREHVKWDYELRAGQPVNTIVARALDIAMTEPRGPVYLSLPREVLGDELADPGPKPRPRKHGSLTPAPALTGIEQAADWIAGAEAPLIVAGRSGRLPGAFEALGELALEHALPVVNSALSANIATSHPMWLGMINPSALAAADVIVVLDSAVPWIPKAVRLRDDVKLIHVAHDPFFSRIPFRGYQIDLALAGDPVLALIMLREALRTKANAHRTRFDARRKCVAERRAKFDEARGAALKQAMNARPMSTIAVAHALNQVKARNAIISEELGVPLTFLDMEEPNCFLSTSSGALGMGIGQALGAKLAAPDRQVIATIGDGSYMFGCPTPTHFVQRSENLPTLTMIMNNSQWYAVRSATLRMYPSGHASRTNALPVVSLTPSPDYEKIVETCGGYGERVEDPEKLVPAIERAFKKMEDGIAVTLNVITADRAPL